MHTYLLRRIPVEVWRRAKAVAAVRATTLRELILAGLRELPELRAPAPSRKVPPKVSHK